MDALLNQKSEHAIMIMILLYGTELAVFHLKLHATFA